MMVVDGAACLQSSSNIILWSYVLPREPDVVQRLESLFTPLPNSAIGRARSECGRWLPNPMAIPFSIFSPSLSSAAPTPLHPAFKLPDEAALFLASALPIRQEARLFRVSCTRRYFRNHRIPPPDSTLSDCLYRHPPPVLGLGLRHATPPPSSYSVLGNINPSPTLNLGLCQISIHLHQLDICAQLGASMLCRSDCRCCCKSFWWGG